MKTCITLGYYCMQYFFLQQNALLVAGLPDLSPAVAFLAGLALPAAPPFLAGDFDLANFLVTRRPGLRERDLDRGFLGFVVAETFARLVSANCMLGCKTFKVYPRCT